MHRDVELKYRQGTSLDVNSTDHSAVKMTEGKHRQCFETVTGSKDDVMFCDITSSCHHRGNVRYQKIEKIMWRFECWYKPQTYFRNSLKFLKYL